MTTEQQAYTTWGDRIADRVEHQDLCSESGGGCSGPFSTRVVLCPIGQRLADVEEQAHQAWRESRRVGTAVAS